MWRSRTIWALALVLLLVGCSSRVGGEVEVVSIRHLTSLYGGYPIEINTPVAIEGEVISTDRSGEFYQRVIVQDATGGISIMVAHKELYTLHSRGDKLRIEPLGLTLGGYGHAVRLGAEGTNEQVAPLTPAEWNAHHTKVGVSPSLTITPLTIASIGAENIATLALFEGVRFVEAGEPWAEEKTSLSRHIVDDSHPTDTLQVRLSGYSDFHTLAIPKGRCSVVGVVDYFNDHYQLLIDSPDAVLQEP